MKAAMSLLVILAIGLGVALFMRHTQAIKDKQAQQERIAELEQKLEEKSIQLDDQERISAILRTNLNMTSQELQSISNNYVQTAASLRQTQADAKAAAEAAKVAEENAKNELAKKETRIGELQNQGEQLTVQIDGLQASLTDLNTQIADTEAKLAAAEGDREFLLKELKRLKAEKDELERQFHDLAQLRTQVSKLKEELSVSRRLEWIRMGIYGAAAEKKGAELLMEGLPTTEAGPTYDLNVELRQDGGAKIVSPETNAPANPE